MTQPSRSKTGIQLIEAAAFAAAASPKDISAYSALHTVLEAESEDHRADCEAMAREWFDARYGRNSWRVMYGAAAAGALMQCSQVLATHLVREVA